MTAFKFRYLLLLMLILSRYVGELLNTYILARWKKYLFLLIIICYSLSASVGAQPIDPKYLQERHPRRLALVIGNYDYEHHSKLPGVKSDVKEVVFAFKELKFDVIHSHENVVDWESFNYDVFKPFRAEIRRDDLVIVYLSGHGFVYQGFQYFAPSEMPRNLEKGKVASTAIPIESLIDSLGKEGPAAVLLVVDACRTIPNDLIIDTTGDLVQKGEYVKHTTNSSTEYILALSVESGRPSLASTDPNVTSVYTAALVKYLKLKPHMEFSELHKYVKYDVLEATDSKQRAGEYDYSMTKIFLSYSDAWTIDHKELWKSLLLEADPEKVRQYVGMRTLSPFVQSARLWLKENQGVSITRSSPISPLSAEVAWFAKGASVNSLTSEIRFRSDVRYGSFLASFIAGEDVGAPESSFGLGTLNGIVSSETTEEGLIEYSQWLSADTGAFVPQGQVLRAEPRASASSLQGHSGTLVPSGLSRVEPLSTISRVTKIPERITKRRCVTRLAGKCQKWTAFDETVMRTVTSVVPDPNWRPTTWLAVESEHAGRGYLSLNTRDTRYATVIGRPTHEAVIRSREPQLSGLVDAEQVAQAVIEARLNGNELTWASTASSVSHDEEESALNDFMVSNLRYHLVNNGVSGEKITTVTEDPTVDTGTIRIRFFTN